MSDTLFLLALLLPPVVVVAGFITLLAPLGSPSTRRSLPRVDPSRATRLVSH